MDLLVLAGFVPFWAKIVVLLLVIWLVGSVYFGWRTRGALRALWPIALIVAMFGGINVQ